MAKNALKWLETEYCGKADVSIQPVLINDAVILILSLTIRGTTTFLVVSMQSISIGQVLQISTSLLAKARKI